MQPIDERVVFALQSDIDARDARIARLRAVARAVAEYGLSMPTAVTDALDALEPGDLEEDDR